MLSKKTFVFCHIQPNKDQSPVTVQYSDTSDLFQFAFCTARDISELADFTFADDPLFKEYDDTSILSDGK